MTFTAMLSLPILLFNFLIRLQMVKLLLQSLSVKVPTT